MHSKLARVVMVSTGILFFGSSTAAFAAVPRVLHSNGPFITSPAGGTGNIAGQPLSRPESFPLTPTLNGTSPGINTTISNGQKAADDFLVPDGGWDIDQLVVYAYQAPPGGATTFSQTITTVKINLWNATPFSANSPSLPPGLPIPQPMLAEPLTFNVTGQGEFVAHRTSGNSTTTIRPIYKFTLPADGLPNGGRLDAGQYWLEMSFDDSDGVASTITAIPLVTPRASAFNHNARLFNVPFTNAPLSWFEGREGFGSSVNPDGRAYALPFELVGTPEPATLLAVGAAIGLIARRRR